MAHTTCQILLIKRISDICKHPDSLIFSSHTIDREAFSHAWFLLYIMVKSLLKDTENNFTPMICLLTPLQFHNLQQISQQILQQILYSLIIQPRLLFNY